MGRSHPAHVPVEAARPAMVGGRPATVRIGEHSTNGGDVWCAV